MLEPIKNTISRLIQQSRNARHLEQIHAQIIAKSPNLSKPDFYSLISRLLFYAAIPASGSLTYASRIFQTVESPKLNIYNIMIRAYASRPDPKEPHTHLLSLILYKQMLCHCITPDSITIPFVIKECSGRFDVGTGRCVHGQAIKFGIYYDVFVCNSLISFYSVFGFMGYARTVFEEMCERDVVSWNSMVMAYLRRGCLEEAVELFRKMEKKSVITWNSIITGFVQAGRPKDALGFFDEMLCLVDGANGVRPNKFTIASVLSACAHLGAVDQGKWVHGYLRRSGLECDMVIGTALVDMYGKCGCVERAHEVFRQMSKTDTLAWTAMISAFALHGYGKEAFDAFEEMEAQGVKPNHVTFIGLLSACAHSGLAEKSRWCFDLMRSVYTIEPRVYHYACMVDILGRAGLFEESEELIKSMPMKPDIFVWGALLGGCQMHGNIELGESVAQRLIDLEPSNHAFYVNLCDLYAKGGRFDDVKRVRALMKERGIRKEVPGCSMVEIDGVVYEFSVKGSHGVLMEELNWILCIVNNDMKFEGYGQLVHFNTTYGAIDLSGRDHSIMKSLPAT